MEYIAVIGRQANLKLRSAELNVELSRANIAANKIALARCIVGQGKTWCLCLCRSPEPRLLWSPLPTASIAKSRGPNTHRLSQTIKAPRERTPRGANTARGLGGSNKSRDMYTHS